MPTYVYRCCKCEDDQEVIHSWNLVTNKEDDYRETLSCLTCGAIGTSNRVQQAANVATYDMASPNERREMLVKRSRDHFDKKLKDEFHQKNKKGYTP